MNIYKIHTHTHIRRICSSLSVKAILLLAVFAISLYAQAVGTHTFSTLHRGGGRPDTENFVFVIMGDGFTAGAGQTNFLNMAQETSDYLLNHYPFSVFRDRITIHAVQTVSANNSTGFFGYLTAGAANWQPPHPERVTEVLNQHAPATDQVMMYLFGMTAGFGAITVPGYGQILSVGRSLNFHTAYNALSVMIHEIGHSLVGLLDERNPHPVPFRESFNASRNSNSSTNRWRVWNGISNRSKDVIVRGGIFAMEPSTNPATGAEILNWRIPAPGSGDPALADGQSHPCVMRGSDNRTPTFCMTCAASIIRSMAHRLGYVHFTGDETLKHGYIPVGQTRVLDATFAGCFELETVSIPSTATQIGRFAFIRNHALREITNFAAIPQPINDSVFFQVANRQNITLRVPAGSVALFQAAPVWRDFNVVAIPGGITEPARNRLNITRTRVNTWSTQGDDIFRANHLTDGNWRNIWHSNYGGGSGSTGVGEAFVDIDLGSVQTVSSIEIDRGFRAGWSNIHSVRMFTHAESGNTFPNGQRIPNTFPANVSQTDINADFAMTGWTERTPSRTQGLAQPHTSSIDVSNNVVPWQVNNQASASAVILSFDAPITARYIRLGITNRNIHNQVAHTVISAIRAFGGEGSTLPPVEYQFSFALEGGAFVGGFTPPPSPA
ncbi:MAG: leucine-rich repeat domain-containing protein, partial [Chitinivibrionia bacterium]|nr:leucine-rich repeat domain-containing protein [Chitinivibrionia bacterium]